MLLPIVTSIARDSLNQVPKKLRNAATELEQVDGKQYFQ